MLFCSTLQLRDVAGKVRSHLVARKGLALRLTRRAARFSCRSFQLFFRRLQHCIGAICQALQRLTCTAPRPLVALECPVDPFQYGFEGHARLLPRLHNRPIERRDKEVRSPLFPEILFDFRKVIEIVPAVHFFEGSADRSGRPTGPSVSRAFTSVLSWRGSTWHSRARRPRRSLQAPPDSFPKSIANPSASGTHPCAECISSLWRPDALVRPSLQPLRSRRALSSCAQASRPPYRWLRRTSLPACA